VRIWLTIALCAGTAYADGDQALSVGAGLATFSVPAPTKPGKTPVSLAPDVGFTVGGIYEKGFSTDLSLRGEAFGSVYWGGEQKGESSRSMSGLVDGGVLFRFDALKYVPYAFAGVGVAVSGGGPIDTDPSAVVVVGGGLDIQQSRKRSWGAELRIASFAGDVTLVSLNARGSIRWGFF
jgi:hypothetical protein